VHLAVFVFSNASERKSFAVKPLEFDLSMEIVPLLAFNKPGMDLIFNHPPGGHGVPLSHSLHL
jgi:hypothetical protein